MLQPKAIPTRNPIASIPVTLISVVTEAEPPTRAFVDAYAAAVPDPAYLTNVPFHWARHALHSFAKQLKDVEDGELELHPKASFCRAEFETALAGPAGGA